MTGSAIGTSLNYGYAGTVSRSKDSVIESRPVKSDSADIPYGHPVIQNTDDTYSKADATLTAANFGGIAVATVKQMRTYPNTTDNTPNVYKPLDPCDVIKEGVVCVKMAQGNPTTGGAVYVRTALNGAFPAEVIGDLRAAADAGNTVQLTNASWYSNRKDVNGIAELKLKYPNN